MSKETPDIRILELSKYIMPKPKEDKFKGYVMNGDRNKFYRDMQEAYKGSVTHRAVVNSIVSMLYGKGLMVENNDLSEIITVKKILNKRDLRSIITDYVIYNSFCFQVVKNGGKGLSRIKHLDVSKTAPEIADKDGVINNYYFSKDWEKMNLAENKPQPIATFSNKKSLEVYVYKPYTVGNDYFSEPKYLSGMQYMFLEQEMSNYYLSHIKNGLSFGYVVNIPNGATLTKDQKNKLENDIKNKLTGSENAGKFVLNFQMGEQKITVDVIQLNDAHKQWQYLTSEARQQILTSHGVVSPMLFGIKDNTGLGNNANELEEAREQLMDYVIKPMRNEILDSLEEVLEANGLFIDLSFKDIDKTSIKEEVKDEEKEELSAVKHPLSEEENDNLDDFFAKGETPDKLNTDFNEVAFCDVDDYEEENKIHLATTGTARPNSKSEQDFDTHLIRYRYVGKGSGQREFCNKMIKANKLYRKEDIEQLTNKVVNKGFGVNGSATYNIWLYKGGARCQHKWQRVIFLRKGKSVDAKSPLAEVISTTKARSLGYKTPANNNKVSIEPKKMKNRGFVNPPSKKDIQAGI